MLRSRWLPRAEWEALFRRLGAEPLAGSGRLNTAEWWRIPGRAPFVVPVEADGRCEFWAVRRIYEAQGGRPLHSDD